MKQTSSHRPRLPLWPVMISLIATVLQRDGVALTVKNTKDNAPGAALIPGSLRWAIATTPAKGTVDFDPSLKGGTVLLKAGQLVVDKALHIKGPGRDSLTVSGGDKSRVFFVSGAGEPGALNGVILSGMTITKGKAGGPPEELGGLSPQGNGGGIYNVGMLRLERLRITGNKAPASSGGGIYNRGTLNPIVECTISGNSAGQHGGGICNEQDMIIERSAIFDNVADGCGGGIQEAGTSQLVNTTVARNRAAQAGGGIHDATGSTLTAFNVTISGNSAEAGGGVAVLFGTWDLQNSIIAGNSATTAPDVRNVGDPAGGGTVGQQISVGNNLIGETMGSGAGSFIDSDKLDLIPKLGPLQDNGGPTPTMALLPGSAAIDSGNNKWIEPPIIDPAVVADQRAFMPRVIDGGNGPTVDMGAYEYASAKELKTRAVALLTPCRSSKDPVSAKGAASAIRGIEISLDARLWVNDALLGDCGALVFSYGSEAALALGKIFKSGRDSGCLRAAQDAVSCVLLAEEQILRGTIEAAEANSGGAEFIAAAREELTKARVAADRGDFAQALGHYGLGWRSARKAQGIQPTEAGDAACRELKGQLEKDAAVRWGNDDRSGDPGAKNAPGNAKAKAKSSRPRRK